MESTAVTAHFDLPQQSRETARLILKAIHYFSPAAILVFFLVSFIVRSIYGASPTDTNRNEQKPIERVAYGPGGKPLPQRRLTGLKRRQDNENDFSPAKKVLFSILTSLACASFTVSAGVILVHFLTDRTYWCGEQIVVSRYIAWVRIRSISNPW